jgi:phosphosulfolactate phosphohydrolase-like enzyme
MLFSMLETIENASDEELEVVMQKAKMTTDLSKQVIDIAKTKINALSIMQDLTIPAQASVFKTVGKVSQKEVDEQKLLS